MSNASTSAGKGIFTATVASNRQIGDCFCTMDLAFTGPGAEAFARFVPGQFVQIDVSGVGLPPMEQIPASLRDACHRKVLLRRPFSFAEIGAEEGRTTAELLYCVLGPASVRMTTLQRGDPLSVIGPLGNGFRVPEGKRTALLVIGGMGTPPIRCLAQHLTAKHPSIEAVAFVGAVSEHALPFEGQLDEVSQQLGFCVPTFAKHGIPSVVATDDGSIGYRGLVTECLVQWLDQHGDKRSDETIIYACGPEPMLSAVARIAGKWNVDCQVSMERRMACGIGLCQSCAIECRVDGSEDTVYKLCCQDGPVFDAREVVFDA
jgi:dihydroorotate dehydrogenase electron transfer subunit